jgi:hypothetical protein
MENEKTVAILICYIGKLPWYFDYFVFSCSYNPTIDFFIISNDTSFKKPLPNNITLINKSLSEISEIATKKMGFEININHSYKLCDFKPAYGLIFEDLIKKYDFWGFGDIDVIYGNIRNFITKNLLENFDLISVRPDWTPGCFLLFKNEKKMNLLFKKSKDYEKVFTSDIHFCFDETNFAHDSFTEGKHYLQIDTEIESMMHVIKKLEEENYIKPFFDLFIIEGIPGKLIWNKGKMTYRNKYEILLYHLIELKSFYKPKKIPQPIPDYFTISQKKINYSKSIKP